MLSSKQVHQLAQLFENIADLPSKNQDLGKLIDILNSENPALLNNLVAMLQKYKKANPPCTSLLDFITQYQKVCSETESYKDTVHRVKTNVTILEQNLDKDLQKISINSYLKILELAGHHPSMYDEQEDKIHKTCFKLNTYLAQNNKKLHHFNEFFLLEQQSKEAFEALDLEFQKELKDTLYSGDILQPRTKKIEQIIPGLHDNDSLWDKLYFWFKNKLTKHAHSALMVFDKEDKGAMHYSHIVESYQCNKVELHHLFYSDIYRVKTKLFKNKEALSEYRTIHENLYALCTEEAGSPPHKKQQVRLENDTLRKIMSGLVNLLYRILPAIGRWIAKDTSTDEAIRSVLTTPMMQGKQSDAPAPTKMFCSEFVANTMNIAASQSFALFDVWKIKRRARYLPPEGLAEHLRKEDLVESIAPEELNMPLMQMFSKFN